jgi:O-antigen ligase
MLNIKENIKKLSLELVYILLVMPVLFLLVNKYPYLLVSSVIASIIAGFVFFIRKRAITNLHSELDAILLIIFLYLVLSYFVSGQNLKNFFSYQFLRNDGNFFFCYILFFVFSLANLDYRKIAQYFFKIIFFIFTVFSCIGLVEYFFGRTSYLVILDPGSGKMYFALNNAHNATGSVYAIVCISLLVFFFKGKKIKIRLFYLALLLINIFALFLTKSRSGYLGFAAAAVVVIWLHFKSIKKFLITLGILTAGAIPIIFITGSFKRLIQIRPADSFTTVVRLFTWEKAWNLFSQSPLFGIGYGRFNDVYNIDKGLFDLDRLKGIPGVIAFYMKGNFVFDAAHAHNSYLQFLTETGVVGFILLMLFWVLCMIKILNMYNNTKDDFGSKVLLSSFGSIIVILILSFFENYLSATTVMVPVSMLVAISIGVFWESRQAILKLELLNDLKS